MHEAERSPSTLLIDALHWRYATKKFDRSKKIPAETWATLERSLLLTPSSYGLQPWRFYVVTSDEMKRKLFEKCLHQQQQVLDCSHLVIFALRFNLNQQDVDRFVRRVAMVRGITLESIESYHKHISESVQRAIDGRYINGWMARQIYIALGQFLASCALLRVDACPMEGMAVECNSVLQLTGSPYSALCACAAGYRSNEDPHAAAVKVRFPRGELVVQL